jgi:aminoglycoside phosphotransferase (APT) family kinase protein
MSDSGTQGMLSRSGPANLLALGRTAEVYAWDEGRVLKLFFDWCPESWVQQEARVTRAVHAAGLPVPDVEDMLNVDGRPGIIFERVDGQSMVRRFRERPWTVTSLGYVLGELHARMHSCEVPGLPSMNDSLERRVNGLEGLEPDLKRAVLGVLSKLPGGQTVCHGDFHPDNVLLTAQGPIIIDWMTATQGYPLADVARTATILEMAGPPPGVPGGWLLTLGARLVHRAYLARYFRLRPGSRQQLRRWQIPVAAARLAEQIPGEQERLLAIVRNGLRELGYSA